MKHPKQSTREIKMRNLSVKQKNALKELKDASYGIVLIEDLNADEIDRIESMNPHECFFQNANRYLNDLEFAKCSR
jgi:hypothetical protein